jgi:hypothetical protein
MKFTLSASAALLLAGLGLAPLAAAQTVNSASSQPAIGQPATQPSAAPVRRQQAELPSKQTVDPPAGPAGMGTDSGPYPPGYGLYTGGN